MIRWPLLAAALFALGCGPSLVWFGRGPDRRHIAAVIESDGMQRVRIDGRDGPEVLGVGVEGLVLGPDGHVAYPARRPGGWTVIHDGRAGQLWEGIGAVALSPDGAHMAYAAERAGRWQVVHDGRAGPAFDAILARSLEIGQGGKLLYAAERAGKIHAVIDGEVGPPWDAVAGMSASPGGGRVGYVASRGDEAFAVVDGAQGPPFERVSHLRWSPAGDRVAYVGRRSGVEHVVVDGALGPPFEAVMVTSPVFDATGRRFAFAMRRAGKWRVVGDGEEGPAFDEVDPPSWSRQGTLGYIGRTNGGVATVVIGRKLYAGWGWASDLVFGEGGRFAHLGSFGDQSFVVDEHGRVPLEMVIRGTLAFGRDGRRWGLVAGDRRARKLFFALEGGARRALDAEELVAAVAKLAPAQRLAQGVDEAILRRWVAAEIDAAGDERK